MSLDARQASSPRQANLHRLLSPRHIAFLGGETAGRAIRVCRDAGYRGEIYTVHPKRREIEGIACIPRVADLPVAPDACFLVIPADTTIEAVKEVRAIGAAGAVCYA